MALCGLVFGLLHILQLSLVTFFHHFRLSGVANVFVELLIANCIKPRGTLVKYYCVSDNFISTCLLLFLFDTILKSFESRHYLLSDH